MDPGIQLDPVQPVRGLMTGRQRRRAADARDGRELPVVVLGDGMATGNEAGQPPELDGSDGGRQVIARRTARERGNLKLPPAISLADLGEPAGLLKPQVSDLGRACGELAVPDEQHPPVPRDQDLHRVEAPRPDAAECPAGQVADARGELARPSLYQRKTLSY